MILNINKIISKVKYTNIKYRTFVGTTREITLKVGALKFKYINAPHGVTISFFYKDREFTINI